MTAAAPASTDKPKRSRRQIERRGSGRRLPYQLGEYELFDHIGRGGMADIYRARKAGGFGVVREVVVKEVLPELSTADRMVELLASEAKTAARLEHPNIVRVEHLGREDGTLFIAMEYVDGLDLREVLRGCARQELPLPTDLALRIVIEVLRALDHAHRHPFQDEDGKTHVGIVHRDVSPSNVLLAFEGEVKLCDFGIARAHDDRDAGHLGTWTQAMIEGKAGYMSPEQAHGEPLDGRADVYAAGILLWELTSGKKLYKARGDEPLIEVARRAKVPKLPTGDLPQGDRLARIAKKALAKDRKDRYATAGEMLADVEAYARENELLASSMKLGRWLDASFGDAHRDKRRRRELATEAVARGAVAVLKPVERVADDVLGEGIAPGEVATPETLSPWAGLVAVTPKKKAGLPGWAAALPVLVVVAAIFAMLAMR